MASVFSTLKPNPSGLKSIDNESLRVSQIRLDNNFDVVAYSGFLFENKQYHAPTLAELCVGWLDQFGIAIDFKAVTEKTKKSETPLSYNNALSPLIDDFRCNISILPQYSAMNTLREGISILFHPSQSEFAKRTKQPNTTEPSLEKSKEELIENLRAFSVALEISRVTSWQFFPQDDGRLEIHGAWREQIGSSFPSEGSTLREFMNFVHPDDHRVLKSLADHFQRGDTNPFEIKYRIRNQEGGYEYILSRGLVLERDSLGNARRTIGTFTDINELKLYEKRLNSALENGRQGFWEWNSDGSIKLSASWHALFGYALNEIEQLSPDFSELIHPEDRAHTVKSFETLFRDPDHIHRVEYRLRHKQGHYLWVADQGATIERDISGKANRIIGSMVDISPHRKALQETKNSREFLQLVLDEIPDQIFWKDGQHRILGCNRSYATLLGFSKPSEVVGKTTRELYGAEAAINYERDDDNVLYNGTNIVKEERPAVNSEGHDFWTEITKLPLALKTNDDNNQPGVLCHFREITQESADLIA